MNFEERIWDAINVIKKKYDYTSTILINMINENGVIEAAMCHLLEIDIKIKII
jgi:hypothetical protein